MSGHFCHFKIAHKEATSEVDIKTVEKEELKELVGDYTLMLSNMKEGGFRENFTLVYHAWDVLECSDITPLLKGGPVLSARVFTLRYKSYPGNFIE